MSAEVGDFQPGLTVKHLDLVVAATADDPATIVLHTGDALVVADDGPGAHMCRPVPDLDVPVSTRRHNLAVVYLHRVDCRAVALQAADHGPGWGHGIVVGGHGEVVAVVLDGRWDGADLVLISQVAVAERLAVEHLDRLVFGTCDQDALVEPDIQHRLAVRVLERLDR